MLTSRRRTLLGALVLTLAAALGGAAPASAAPDDYDRAARAIQGVRTTVGDLLGPPVTEITPTPLLEGYFQHFDGGASIYWSRPSLAHVVYGDIRRHWEATGWEWGAYGFPVSSEYDAPECGQGGRRSDFEGGSICWSPQTGTHGLPRFNLKVFAVQQTPDGVVAVSVRSAGGPGTVKSATCETLTGPRRHWSADLDWPLVERVAVRTDLHVPGQQVRCTVVAAGPGDASESWKRDNTLTAVVG